MGRLSNANLLESSVKKTKFGVPKVKSLPGTVISFSFCCGNIHCHALKLMDDSFSAAAEDLFFSFSAFRPRPKCFFLLFFTRRPWPKANFCRFLSVRRGRNAEFAYF